MFTKYHGSTINIIYLTSIKKDIFLTNSFDLLNDLKKCHRWGDLG